MVNNPKDIKEIISMIDSLSFEQLDYAIRYADRKFQKMEEYNRFTGNYH